MVDLLHGPGGQVQHLDGRVRHQNDVFVGIWSYLNYIRYLELLLHLELDFPALLRLAHESDGPVVSRADENISLEVEKHRPDRESVDRAAAENVARERKQPDAAVFGGC